MPPRLQTAIRAARAAGKVLREKFNDTRQVRSKGKRDIVTDADYAADRTQRAIIHARFPRDHFMSEEDDVARLETLWSRAQAADCEFFWIADPLDGTTNYAHRVPVFAVSLALFHANSVQLGVVYDPICDELFSAERGCGAYLNDRLMHVSATRAFGEAVVGAEWARAPKLRERSTAIFARMVTRSTSARALGSAALSVCYVAAARLDAYFHLSLFPWDVAAAALIVEEAGGRITTPTGAAWSIHSQAYVVSNGHLHSQMLRYFKS